MGKSVEFAGTLLVVMTSDGIYTFSRDGFIALFPRPRQLINHPHLLHRASELHA